MKIFVTGSGAQDFELLAPVEDWTTLRQNALRLLRARGNDTAVAVLEKYPWQMHEGTNFFGDGFMVLHAALPVETYVEIVEEDATRKLTPSLRIVACAIQELGHYVRFVAASPSQDPLPALVSEPELKAATATVERALIDAQNLLQSSGPASAVDRVHTAIHGYIRSVLRTAEVEAPEGVGLTKAFKLILKNHQSFKKGDRSDEHAERILQAMTTILDSLNTLRNRSSVAHPNERLLEDPEAVLAVNAVRTLLHYLESKIAEDT